MREFSVKLSHFSIDLLLVLRFEIFLTQEKYRYGHFFHRYGNFVPYAVAF